MTDGFDALKPARIESPDVTRNELDPLESGRHRTSEKESIDDAHFVAARDKLVAKLQADVAGAAGNEYFQRFASDMNGVIGTLVSARSR
jgi:hypothetical protein